MTKAERLVTSVKEMGIERVREEIKVRKTTPLLIHEGRLVSPADRVRMESDAGAWIADHMCSTNDGRWWRRGQGWRITDHSYASKVLA